MEKVVVINNLYFQEHKTLTEISKIVNTSVSYISRVLKKNENYKNEKQKRMKINLEQRRKKQKELNGVKRKIDQDGEYINLRKKHNQAVIELSKKSSFGNNALRKWCSVYTYNKEKKCYEFDKKLTKPRDFPMYIKA